MIDFNGTQLDLFYAQRLRNHVLCMFIFFCSCLLNMNDFQTVVYSYTCRCKQKHNDDFNERTNTLLYKNIPLTLYSRNGCERVVKGLMLVMCERWVGDGHRLLYIDPQFFWRIAALLPHFAGCSTVGHWGPKPSVWSWFSVCRHPFSNCDWNSLPWTDPWNWLTQAVCGTWLYNCFTSTCFLWAYASAPNSTPSTGQGDIPISSTGRTCLRWSSAYLLRCISNWRLGRGSICYKTDRFDP